MKAAGSRVLRHPGLRFMVYGLEKCHWLSVLKGYWGMMVMIVLKQDVPVSWCRRGWVACLGVCTSAIRVSLSLPASEAFPGARNTETCWANRFKPATVSTVEFQGNSFSPSLES